MVRQVQPLRISKTTPASSPNKTMAASRPLSELGSGERRRNSPSYNQATRKMIVSREASPYTENPAIKDSLRALWGRDAMSPSRFDTENTPDRSPSPSLLSPKRRESIEKLKQASRVKTSNIFALQSKEAYDPSSLPIVERPSANRPLSTQLANNTFTRYDSLRKENNPLRSPQRMGHRRTESEIQLPIRAGTPMRTPLPPSPQKEASPSPTKSSLARSSQFGLSFDPEHGAWSDEDRSATPRGLHRHHKSVTFHEEPPVVNEYEEQTPEPSVSAGGSRESSWDSDEYDEEVSFDRGSSAEPHHDDSFDEDLENADKTPVVLPQDWSRMSPEVARTDLVDPSDDVFDDSPRMQRPILGRSESVASDGDSRPLPPLPAFMKERRNSGSLGAAAERASQAHRHLPSPPKRASCSKDEILRMTRESSLTLEDRLRLMSEQKERPNSKHSNKSEEEHGLPEEITVTNLDTGAKLDLQLTVAETEVEETSLIADIDDFASSPPQISRESILRKVRYGKYDFEEDDTLDESRVGETDSQARPSYAELARMHPDEPIPSREQSHESNDSFRSCHTKDVSQIEEVYIKEEPVDDDDDAFDMTAIPTAEPQHSTSLRSPSRMDDHERQSSVLRHDVSSPVDGDDDSGSRYSSVDPEAESTVLYLQRETTVEVNDGKETLIDAMHLLTVKDYSDSAPAKKTGSGNFEGLPAYQSTGDYDFGMKHYITPSPPLSNKDTQHVNIMETAPVLPPAPAPMAPPMKDLPRPTYDGADFSPPVSPVSRPDTPGSVIHHDDSDVSALTEHNGVQSEPVPHESPCIPERRATIRTGGKLKARPSATPADLYMMAEQRRLVSAEHPVPSMPEAYRAELDQTTEADLEAQSSYSSEAEGSKADSGLGRSPESQGRDGEKMALNVDIPAFGGDLADDGLGLDKEFDRLIEAQKKGYLMRQNTKVVVASNRNFSNDSNDTAKSEESAPMSPTGDASSRPNASRATKNSGPSPRKPSADPFLKTEPWNGKARRKSQRNVSAQLGSRSEPAPPLPGQASALGVVDEDFAAGTSSLEDEVAEGVERGRLFVKVVGVKDLDLPMPRNDRLYFQLTLDNGLHCVTTANLELGKTASIGQEFELVVLNDLEFQLTLTTRLPEAPRARPDITASPTKSLKAQKTTGLSRFLTSPKKRAERERQEREAIEVEERRQREEAQRKRASVQPTAWDMLHELVNSADGSFARAYVNLKAHEKHCFGRQLTVDVPCYNEWALENDAAVVNSVRSKRGNAGPVRRPPYVVGLLELQLFYVPKPTGATDADMPKSMSHAVREMDKASDVKEIVHEGHLSQQGGDCVHWRRRFFRLQGGKLTAYHEHTHQKRAVINLSKASRLVDDKSMLVADPKSGNPSSKSGRRKSAFAEEDEGYQYVEEGFRIRFANGETIDFYADSHAEKDVWMQALSQVIGKPDLSKRGATWTDLVLARERVEGVESSPQKTVAPKTTTTDVRDFTRPPAPALSPRKPMVAKSAPTSPMKGPPERALPPAPQASSSRTRPLTPPMNARRGHRSRDAVKSMIF